MRMKPRSYLIDIYYENQDRYKKLLGIYMEYLIEEKEYNGTHERSITPEVSKEIQKILQEISELRNQIKDIERVLEEQDSVLIDVSNISLKKVKKRIGY